jgi:hypothetical protein
MRSKAKALQATQRTAIDRRGSRKPRLRRIEVSVHTRDVDLVRRVAESLFEETLYAEELRELIRQYARPRRFVTGADLVEALTLPRRFRVDLDIVRDKDTGRDISFE